MCQTLVDDRSSLFLGERIKSIENIDRAEAKMNANKENPLLSMNDRRDALFEMYATVC